MDTVSTAALPPGDANEREIMLMHVMTGHTARGPALNRHCSLVLLTASVGNLKD